MKDSKTTLKSVLPEITLFSISLYVSKFLQSIRGIIIPKLLGPVQYGIYNGLMIIPDYLVHFHFGSISALKREVAFAYGRKDFDLANKIKNLVFIQYIGLIFIFVFFLFISTFFLEAEYPKLIINGIRLLCPLILIQCVVDVYLEETLKAENRFELVSKAEIFRSILGFVVVIGMVILWKLYGLLLGLALAMMLKGLYILVNWEHHFKWCWDKDELIRLIKIGFPIVLGLILMTSFESVDRIMVIKFLSSKELGYYALALTIMKFLLIFQVGVYRVLEPKIYKLYAKVNDIKKMKDAVWQPLCIMTNLYPLIMGLVFIAVPYFIHYLFPKYIQTISCAEIMVLGSFFFFWMKVHIPLLLL